MLPIPATFVVGTDGLIKARFVDPVHHLDSARIATRAGVLESDGRLHFRCQLRMRLVTIAR